MILSELNTNYLFACIKYALDQSDATTVGDYSLFHQKCGLSTDPVTGNVQIDSWDVGSVPQPSQEDLLAIDLADLDPIIDLHNDMIKAKNDGVLVTVDRDAVTPYVSQGKLLYDKNDSKLKIYIDGSWITLN